MTTNVTTMPADIDAEISWEGFLGEFAVYQRAGGLSEKTISNRAECYLALAKHTGKTPQQITKGDLLAMMTRPHARTGEQLSPNTKQAERSYLQALFQWMQEEGHRPDDPSAKLPKVKIPRRHPRPLRIQQIEGMLDSGIYARTRDIITIAALSGLRIGEIVKIRGEDVDLEGQTIATTRKGNFEHRVPLHPVLVELAERYPREGWWFPSPFPNEKFPNGGGHILMASASDRVGKAIRAAGVTDRKITGHSLRHFYASQLMSNGANIRVIQEMLGHASLATTQLYTEVTEVQTQAAVELLAGIDPRKKSGRRAAEQRVRFSA